MVLNIFIKRFIRGIKLIQIFVNFSKFCQDLSLAPFVKVNAALPLFGRVEFGLGRTWGVGLGNRHCIHLLWMFGWGAD